MSAVLLSDLYWRLHRNATISSFLLFLASNQFLHISEIEGTVVKLDDSLLTIFLAAWATYAIAVFAFEGGREGSVKSVEARAEITRRQISAENAYQQIAIEVNTFKNASGQALSAFRNSLQYLEANKKSDSPPAENLKKRLLSIYAHDFSLFQEHANERNFHELYSQTKIQMFDEIYNQLTSILQLSKDELKIGIVSIDGSLKSISTRIDKLEGTLKKEKRATNYKITAEKVRVILTGRALPIAFYIFSVMHFFGNYIKVTSSSLDYLRWMHVY